MSHSLDVLGCNPDVLDAFLSFAPEHTSLARVIQVHRGQVDVATQHGPLRALIIHHDDLPAVGDWVCVRESPDGVIPPLIQRTLPRRTAFRRKVAGKRSNSQVVAANLDVVLIAMGLDQDLSASRLHRYIAAVATSGAQAVVLFTKCDVCPAPVLPVLPVPHVLVSALTSRGVAEVRKWIPPRTTAAILGASGTGKSTLANALVGDDVQETGGVRLTDDRGKHTTTSRVLLQIPGGGCLIDTPGMRELALDISTDADEAFADIAALADTCRYRDCSHNDEPGCAVQAAVHAGHLDPARLHSRNKVAREIAFEQRRKDPDAQRRHAKRWRQAVAERQRWQKNNAR